MILLDNLNNRLSLLEEVFLDFNQLKTIPKPIFQLKSILFLGLSNNQLTILPDDLEKMSNLKVIFIENNPLEVGTKDIIDRLRKRGLEFHYYRRAKKL